jgi:ABC-2 type transport system ATP-binding protein
MAAREIEVQGLVREFKKGPRAVDGIDLHVDAGEIYGFLGPNGAGKSTTVKMLTTLLPPSGGRALVGGHDVSREGPAVRKLIGVALQDAALDPLLTAREHFRLQGGLQGFSRRDADARGDELLERVGLTGAADRKVGKYSGGMKRRLDLALALVHHPQIVFLDEPTTGLDPQSRAALWEEVRRLAKDQGVTVFLTTQYLEEADVLAARIGIIDRGTIVAEGTPLQLKSEIGRPTVEIVPEDESDLPRAAAVLKLFGEPVGGYPGAAAVRLSESDASLAEVVRALDSAGVPVANLDLHAPTLDDVFLAKTGRSLEGAGEGAGAEEEPAPEVRLEVAVEGRSRVERLPTSMLKDWRAERRVQGQTGAAGAARPAIAIREGPLAGQQLEVADSLVLGREAVDLTLPDEEVSRRHAVFRIVEGSLVIEDLRSLNGTWVNGRRIELPTLLTPGDVVQVGKTLIEVQR